MKTETVEELRELGSGTVVDDQDPAWWDVVSRMATTLRAYQEGNRTLCTEVRTQRAELAALRRSRAQERAQAPVGPVAVVEGIRHILSAPELVGTVQAVKDLVDERDRLKLEVSSSEGLVRSLGEAVDRLKAELGKMRQALATARARPGNTSAQYRAALAENERLRGKVAGLEREAEQYRKTIRELRGPARPKATLEPVEYVGPRYEVRQIVSSEHASQATGYGVWDCLEKVWHWKWGALPGHTLDDCQAAAIAEAERLNREAVDACGQAVHSNSSEHVHAEAAERLQQMRGEVE